MSEEQQEAMAIWAEAANAYHHALTSRGTSPNKAAATVIAEALIAERQRGYAAGIDAAAAVACQWEASDYDEACNTMCAQMLDDFRALKEVQNGLR